MVKSVKAEVWIVDYNPAGSVTIGRMRPKKIFIDSESVGYLVDGRQVVKEAGKWFWVPK